MDLNDSYAEYLIKKKPDSLSRLLQAAVLLLILSAVGLILFGRLLGLVAGAALLAAAYLAYLNTGIEYEYLFVDGQLTIDKILVRSRRKSVFTCTVEEMEVLAPTGSFQLDGHKDGQAKRLDYSSGEKHHKTYTLVCQKGGQAHQVVFEPNDHMLQCFRRSAPRKVTV